MTQVLGFSNWVVPIIKMGKIRRETEGEMLNRQMDIHLWSSEEIAPSLKFLILRLPSLPNHNLPCLYLSQSCFSFSSRSHFPSSIFILQPPYRFTIFLSSPSSMVCFVKHSSWNLFHFVTSIISVLLILSSEQTQSCSFFLFLFPLWLHNLGSKDGFMNPLTCIQIFHVCAFIRIDNPLCLHFQKYSVLKNVRTIALNDIGKYQKLTTKISSIVNSCYGSSAGFLLSRSDAFTLYSC